MLYRETSCALCLLLSVFVCVNLPKVALKGPDRSIGSSLQTCFQVFFCNCIHTELLHKMNRPKSYARSIIYACLVRSVQMRVCGRHDRKLKIFFGVCT